MKMNTQYHTPDLARRAFARTNRQTISQRAAILQELLPDARSIADICCGDCTRQREIYLQTLNLESYRGLDICPEIVEANQAKGVDCVCGDALDKTILSQFREFDVIFFGPPLSVDCDGHTLLGFRQVVPSFDEFLRLLLGELSYDGTVVCICPRNTTMGDARWLYEQVRELRHNVGLRLIHYSITTLTGDGKTTEPRLKYVELWLSSWLSDLWEVRQSVMGETKVA
jgi:hypothetical protein